MTTAPELAEWGRLLAVLTVEISLVIGFSALLATRMRSASHRRSVWLASLWAVLFVVAGELVGVRSLLPKPSMEEAGARRVVATVVDPEDAVSVTSPASPSQESGPDSMTGTWWPGIVWLGGALIGTMFLVAGHVFLWLRRRHGSPPEAELEATARRVGNRLGLRAVTLRIWPNLRGPMAYGMWRPVVALPPDFSDRFDPAEREAILLHEIAHLAVRDPLAQAFAGLVGALVWWHPVVAWARRRLQIEMEAAADHASHLIHGGGTALAESLIRLGREWTTPRLARGLGVVGASSPSQLALRVRSLLTASPEWRRPTAVTRGLGVAGAGLLALSLAATAWPGPDSPALARRFLAVAQNLEGPPSTPSEFVTDPHVGPPGESESSPPPSTPVRPDPFAADLLEMDPGITRIREALDTLITRSYAVNLPALLEALRDKPGETTVQVTPEREAGTSDPTVQRLRDWVNNAGISLEPPNGFVIDHRANRLLVRASESELQRLDSLLATVPRIQENSSDTIPEKPSRQTSTSDSPEPPAKDPVVTLEIKFLEITEPDDHAGDLGLDWLFGQTSIPAEPLPVKTPTEGDPGAASPGASNIRLEHGQLENQSAILSQDQLKALLPRLEARGGVTVLAAPRVTATSGQQAQVQVQEARTIVTQVRTNDGAGARSPSIQYETEVMNFGPSVDVVATWTDTAWNLRVEGWLSEFVGYDDPKDSRVEARDDSGRVISGQLPLPRLRVRKILGHTNVQDGQTLLLRGPVAVRIRKTKAGWFRAPRTEVQPVRLYVLVTPVTQE
ncbi:MAG: M56 family metallopeptidase [Limisphaerales bacterium]